MHHSKNINAAKSYLILNTCKFVTLINNKMSVVKTGNPIVSIYSEQTPNPETMKFVANKLMYPGKSIEFATEAEAGPSPMAKELFGFPFVKGVFIASNFVTITKTNDTDWIEATPVIREFLKEYLQEGKAIINEDEIVAKPAATNAISEDDTDVVKRIKEVLENYVNPGVSMDGGAIQYMSYESGVVKLQMQGSCSGCPSSTLTLKSGVEALMKKFVPEIKEVVAEAM
jgi:NFU1 iron-sulfur cluster scaffold homolog, mitochondrial